MGRRWLAVFRSMAPYLTQVRISLSVLDPRTLFILEYLYGLGGWGEGSETQEVIKGVLSARIDTRKILEGNSPAV